MVLRAFLVGQVVKTLPAMQETWVRFLGREDTLEQEMATHSNILAWRILWIKEPGGLHVVHTVTKSWTRLKWLPSSWGKTKFLLF